MRNTLGDGELELLEFILENGPVSVRDASERYGAEAGLARTTVQTMMERLRKKGFLVRHDQEGVFVYQAALERPALMNDLIGQFIRTKLGGSVSPLIAYLTSATKLTQAEKDELRETMERMEEEP